MATAISAQILAITGVPMAVRTICPSRRGLHKAQLNAPSLEGIRPAKYSNVRQQLNEYAMWTGQGAPANRTGVGSPSGCSLSPTGRFSGRYSTLSAYTVPTCQVRANFSLHLPLLIGETDIRTLPVARLLKTSGSEAYILKTFKKSSSRKRVEVLKHCQ